MLVILTVGSPVLLLSVDEKIESLLLFPIFSLGCQNFMNEKTRTSVTLLEPFNGA